MNRAAEVNLIERLANRYRPLTDQSHLDLRTFSGLHPDFIADCVGAIAEKKKRLSAPLLGEIFPHLVAEGLKLPDTDRRQLSAAWLALYGYISLVDFQLDTVRYLDARASLSASALLGWSIGIISQYTVGTSYHDTVMANVAAAFSAQYEDLCNRQRHQFDRTETDCNKNRAILTIIAGYCAAAKVERCTLLDATETLLGTFQILDDLQDVYEDIRENNITTFVKILRSVTHDPLESLAEPEIYNFLLGEDRFSEALRSAVISMDHALILLDATRDKSLVVYLSHLRTDLEGLISKIKKHNENEYFYPDIHLHIRKIICHS
jgi:hypothetical protein